MKFHLRLIAIFFFAFLAGCSQEDDQALEQERTNNQDQPIVNVKDSEPTEKLDLTNSEIAAHLANVASSVPEVNDAAAIVAGPYTVVGIDVDKDLDRSRVGTIKYSVLEALYHDPYGKTAVVIADGDVMERLRDMGYKIQQGQPVQGVIEEIAEIVGRFMPEFPLNENPPQEPDQNKQIMPENKEKELEDIEEEQSNENLNR